MFKYLPSTITLAAIWAIFSGHFDVLFICLGTTSILISMYFAIKMEKVSGDKNSAKIKFLLPIYSLWLVKEIVISSIKVILASIGIGKIDSETRWISTLQKDDSGKTIYGNSITLTPGTVCMIIREDKMLIHALDKKNLDGMEKGFMDKFVEKIV